ncbi:MAG: ABC transporter substrate-binding protein [Bacteriovoracaceae bacterium]|jgi:iron complex transport system substrate-binding protein|nr:cobalamin-binding protein [Halobacteriovoraceae bacterium]MDP7319832.1 ABC transporter substrate-binding protein [Bacteriovoracaceae bacterium]|tara:strand:+ start:606 stop:1418 length:813 start_codon:yes stop_codon:yes gene_type:complete
MEINAATDFPQRIICLTEEPVETLYLLGKEHLIVGVSAFVKRPKEAQKLPKVSFFTSSNYKKILEKKPDLVLGHSDIQKDIARDLIEMGQNVFIANHRSLEEILQYIQLLSRMVDASQEGEKLIKKLRNKINEAKEFTKTLHRRPKVYFEEWDEPQISAIKWVSELIELCGGENIFASKSDGLLAKERFVSNADVVAMNPDIIFACWCGKKVQLSSFAQREGFSEVSAIKSKRVLELPPEIFLQPGPAVFLEGINILIEHFKSFNDEVKI